jgi:hypothetical protein
LLVNLGTRFGAGRAVQAGLEGVELPLSKKIADSGQADAASELRRRRCRLVFWMQARKIDASVDKPMHIHRSECAEPMVLSPADFLSSLRSASIQALYSRFRIT